MVSQTKTYAPPPLNQYYPNPFLIKERRKSENLSLKSFFWTSEQPWRQTEPKVRKEMCHLFSFRKKISTDIRKDLLSELQLMKELDAHSHIIKLLGCVTKSGKYEKVYFNTQNLVLTISVFFMFTILYSAIDGVD